MARRQSLSPEDLELWAAYGRTLTRLMPGKSKLPAPAGPVIPAAPPPVMEAPTPPVRHKGPPAPLGVNAAPAGVDKSTWGKFRAQKIRAEARLDLHGRTAAKAHRDVMRFVEMAHAAGLRCVEIITGNGDILARELPHWLNTPTLRPLILGLAHPHARNSGSVRVLLRRRRA
ncbi:Smr/MutS family protein [Acidocella sp.]|uniref:Smr/MutS family protein n=1 Tax=Acidocella sp. TaxID=50710 RepID=UPI003D014698